MEIITLEDGVHPGNTVSSLFSSFKRFTIGGIIECSDIGGYWWSVSNPTGKQCPFLPQRADEVKLAIAVALICGVLVQGERR